MYRSYSSSQADLRPFRDVEFQIRELTQDFVTSFNTANYEQAASLFASDGVMMAPHYEGAYGHRSVEQLLRQMGQAGYLDLRLETTRVDHSGGMAMELGRFSITQLKPDGTAVPQHGKYVKVWRRLGAWLIVADCWSRTSRALNEHAA
jgi:ketosteroid isomerase-like protein